MKRLTTGQQVVINNEGKNVFGKIKCTSKVQKKMVFYDITLEKGTDIIYVTTNKEHKTYIDLNLTHKIFSK